MFVETSVQGPALLLRLKEPLHGHNIPMYQELFQNFLEMDHDFFVLILDDIKIVSSHGIRLLITLHKSLEAKNKKGGIVTGSTFEELLRMASINKLYVIADSVENVLAGLRQKG